MFRSVAGQVSGYCVDLPWAQPVVGSGMNDHQFLLGIGGWGFCSEIKELLTKLVIGRPDKATIAAAARLAIRPVTLHAI